MATLAYPLADDGKSADIQREINELQAFVDKQPGNYNGGMGIVPLNHVMRETAKHQLCDFADMRDLSVLEKALDEQKNSGQDILLCSAQDLDKNTKTENMTHIVTALETIKNSNKYKKIMFPLGASNYGVSHAMALAVEGNNAYIFEQFGGDQAYAEAKYDIANALHAAGYTVYMNPKKLTERNRLDCATVTTHIITEAIYADSLQTLLHDTKNKSPLFSAQEIDEQHKLDQQYASFALKDIQEGHRDDRNKSEDVLLLQKLLSKSSSLSLENRLSLISEFWNAENKEEFVATYKSPNDEEVLTVDGQLPEADPDQKWKDEVRQAVRKANDQLQNNFQEYQNNDYPKHLFFKDGNNDLAFASKQQAYVGGEQKAFDELCATAVNLGKNTINFGKFEKHPEYKAMLYLACLKHGLKMTNAPEMEELKQYPQFEEINKIITTQQKRAELKNKMAQTRQAFNETQEICNNDPEYQALKKDLDEAKKSGDKDAISAAKEALNGNENAQKLQENRTAYENTLKEAANFYIKNGSGHPYDKSTPEERKEKLNKHLEQYNPKEFFSKDKDGKPLELANKKDLINKYQFAHRVLQNRGNGK